MSRMSTLCLLIALVLLVGCSGYDKPVEVAPPAPPAPPVEIADDDLSYRNEPLLDDSGTPPAPFDAPDPGDSQLEARSFENAPPVIPHNVRSPLTKTPAPTATCPRTPPTWGPPRCRPAIFTISAGTSSWIR